MGRGWTVGWVLAALVVTGAPGVAGPARAEVSSGRVDTLCFTNSVIGSRYDLEIVYRSPRRMLLVGEVVGAGAAFTLPIFGSARLRQDGKLDLILVTGINNALAAAHGIVSGVMNPPDFESGFLGTQIVGDPGPVPVEPALQVPCPTVFPDLP